MKSKILGLVSFISICIIATSCALNAQQRISSKTFHVSAFEAIESNSVANIHFFQGPSTSLRAEGYKDLIDRLNVNVKNGKLIIEMPKNTFKNNNLKNKKLDIYISSPTLNLIEMEGVGNFLFEKVFNAPKLEIVSNGVGNLKADNLNCGHIFICSHGVGNIDLAGKAKNMTISSDGVGNIKAKKLVAQHASVNLSGVGNVAFNCSELMDVELSGVGNAIYYGNPKIKNMSRDGVGKIKQGE
jgi:hypothetical protein